MPHSHFKIYKPYGMLSQFTSGEARQLRKKRFLSELYDFPEHSMSVGRLDEKSEGLLLITTDGKLSDHINTSGIEKEYLVQLDGEISDAALLELTNGVEIGIFGNKYRTSPCKVCHIDPPTNLPEPHPRLRINLHRTSSWISIVLKEGKFRQIRKMTAAVGFPTLRLIRIRIGNITLDKIQVGECKPLENPIKIQ